MFSCLSAAQLKNAGWTSHQIKAARECCLKRIRRGHYVVARSCENPGHEFVSLIAQSDSTHLPEAHTGLRKRNEDLRILVRSYVDDMPTLSTLSHKSALIVHGLPIPYLRAEDELRVETAHPTHSTRGGAVHVRRRNIDGADRVVVDGIRVTTVLRTLWDIARDYPLAFSVAVIDSALHQLLVSGEALQEYAERHPSRTGQSRIDRALANMDGRRETVAESICAMRFVEHLITGFEPQVEIFDEQGRFVARTDFADKEARVVAEFDGAVKYYMNGNDPHQEFEAERAREYRLRNLGYTVFRIRWSDLFSADVFLRIKHCVNVRTRMNAVDDGRKAG